MTQVATIGLDLAKDVFQAHGADANGIELFKKKLRRAEVLGFFKKIPACVVGMEACSTSHYWAREIKACGHEVRIIPAAYVKAFVKRDKTDAKDAEAICEAATRGSIQFVPAKSLSQQAAIIVLRTRQLLGKQKAQLIIAMRYHLAELGLVAPKGRGNEKKLFPIVRNKLDTRIPPAARDALEEMVTQIERLTIRIASLDSQIAREAKNDRDMKRLMTIPGIGCITAATIVAYVSDPKRFKSSRVFSSWLGLTPREHSSGGKRRLGRMSKMGNNTLRSLLVLGALSVLRHRRRNAASWLRRLIENRPYKVAGVALANKMARIVWALLTRGGVFEDRSGCFSPRKLQEPEAGGSIPTG
jgi:transposase